MLTDEVKHVVDAYLTQRDKDFAARQELAVQNRVATALKEVENARRSRLQIFTTLGGAGLVTIGILLWNAIINTAQVTAEAAAEKEIKQVKTDLANAKTELNGIIQTAEDREREIRSIRDRANDLTDRVESSLDLLREAMGEIKEAQGKVDYVRDIMEIRGVLEEMRLIKTDVRAVAVEPAHRKDTTKGEPDASATGGGAPDNDRGLGSDDAPIPLMRQ
jgi:chromosome segregation ATPase